MTLQAELDSLRTRFEAKAPQEALAIMHRATDDLRRSGILARVPKVGELAPEFALPNAAGAIVRSHDLLARGPLVVSFYRGRW